ncbi:NTF2 fold immunity protein [Chryseobacterium kwangjuense]|uniref:NTF2 fold immunity protein n=1 Tax=Chryseobacterium kwangjuense TaxID=267125 RepID=A0ABW9K6Z5_9FLAO
MENCTNEDAVKQIAEQEWLKLYGKKIYKNKPFKTNQKDGIWIVEGTSHTQKGGAPYIEINSKTCEVIKITHSK